MKIAIIPARGGSRRIPRKNVRNFGGQPMLAYAIGAALQSGLFAHVVVTTDDEEIAATARTLGAETPFMRPRELADDHTPTVPVIAHAIRACEELGWNISTACCLYPCVPFIEGDDLRDALQLLQSSGADYAFPVAEFPSAVQRALRRDTAGRLSPIDPRHQMTRTQDLEPAFFDAGQFYWGHREAWLNQPRIHANGAGLPLPAWRVVDIDTEDDWLRAELLHRALATRPQAFVRS